MERHSQQPSQRMQDRSMSHTPAQQPPPSNFSAFHPSTAQPPIQMPFSDPFQNRDPFMPAAQQSRRGSYGIMGPGPASAPSSALSAYGERAWSAHPSGTTFYYRFTWELREDGCSESHRRREKEANPGGCLAEKQCRREQTPGWLVAWHRVAPSGVSPASGCAARL